MNENVLAWLASGDTGYSSRAIVAYLERDLVLLAADGNYLRYPSDPADLGRCVRLLDIEPTYRARIREMANVGPEWAALVARWAELEALYREEAPSGCAPKCYDAMRECIEGRGRLDPASNGDAHDDTPLYSVMASMEGETKTALITNDLEKARLRQFELISNFPGLTCEIIEHGTGKNVTQPPTGDAHEREA